MKKRLLLLMLITAIFLFLVASCDEAHDQITCAVYNCPVCPPAQSNNHVRDNGNYKTIMCLVYNCQICPPVR